MSAGAPAAGALLPARTEPTVHSPDHAALRLYPRAKPISTRIGSIFDLVRSISTE